MIEHSAPHEGAQRINLAETPDFDIGGLHVSPAHRQAASGDKQIEMEPRVAKVLVALAAARPAVVSRDRLIEQCWDGRIVGDDALNRCILALRQLARDFSPEPFKIETVKRVGYSLIENGAKSSRTSRIGVRQWATIAFALIAMVVAFTLFMRSPGSEDTPASVAVLPFRNLSAGDPHFAEGISEEILSQLAREPAFRVAGRSSAAQFEADPDPREVGRVLGVDYILEGSVRSAGDRIRISAALVQTKDGMRLWSETYDRQLKDVLSIQAAIGQAVANGLKRRLVRSQVRGVSGEAYALYLNARGLLRSANPQSGHEAVKLLEQVVRVDPSFAAGWASLAEALLLDGRAQGQEGLMANLPRAFDAAQRALRLDPALASAHSVLGQVLGNESPQAVAHLRQAAALDARSADAQMSGAVAQEVSGNYAEAVAGYHRAHDLDPLWPVPLRALVNVYPIMGDRSRAEAVAKSGFADEPMTVQFALARVAWSSGDFSDGARRWALLIKDPAARWASPSRVSLEETKYLLGLSNERPSRPPLPVVGSARFGPRAWMDHPPSPAEWAARTRSLSAALIHYDENIVAAKLMLNAGRARELTATYDSPIGVLGIRRGERIGPCQLDEAALVALALRATGRAKEAETLLREADAMIQRLYRRGPVPTWFDEDAAAIWAVQGKVRPAVEALDRARARGWVHTGRTDLLNIADEPAFGAIRQNVPFKAVVARHGLHMAKERKETVEALRSIEQGSQ